MRDMDVGTIETRFPSSKVFCNPALLLALQSSDFRPFADSKTLVDLRLSHHPDYILQEFESLPCHPTREQYNTFLQWAFTSLPEDKVVQPIRPEDQTHFPPSFLTPSCSPILTAFISDLKHRWGDLCRVFRCPDAQTQSKLHERSSLIYLPHPFFVPGGRFRECYYWDTLWIVKGLIASDMLQSAKQAVRNLLYLVTHIGFVPNGNRVYYLNRSQPPTLTESVLAVYKALPAAHEKTAWLQEAVPVLETEYNWFVKTHSVAKIYPSHPVAQSLAPLSVYHVQANNPRPESFEEDRALITSHPDYGSQSSKQKISRALSNELASAAESGWDFSSRWFADASVGLSSIQTSKIVPCCLNSILLKAEKTISYFHEQLLQAQKTTDAIDEHSISAKDTKNDHATKAHLFAQFARDRQRAINKFMWCDEKAIWLDFDLTRNAHTTVVSSAGLMPAWAGCWQDGWQCETANKFIDHAVNSSGLVRSGRLACTANTSSEQWDFPNCWAPLVDMVCGGFRELGEQFPSCGGQKAAEDLAVGFVRTACAGWVGGKVLHEKYEVVVGDGRRGEGGEYVAQTGFGWTNGTILWIVKEFIGVFEGIDEESWKGEAV